MVHEHEIIPASNNRNRNREVDDDDSNDSVEVKGNRPYYTDLNIKPS